MQPALFRLEALFEEYEHVPDMLVLGSSDAQTRTTADLLHLSGETLNLDTRLGYTEPRGEPALRDAIARMHGRAREQVLVTVGASEAIFLLLHALDLEDARVLVCTPAYPSIPEMARNAGARIEAHPFPEGDDFRPDVEVLAARLANANPPYACVFLNSPHNPTGRVLQTAALLRIFDAAYRAGTHVIVDEVMTGIFAGQTERVPSAAYLSEKAIVIGNVSKSLGLGGLRIGWIVAPVEIIDRCAHWRFYTTISPPAIVQQLARIAVEHRAHLLAENESVVRTNHQLFAEWCARHPDALQLLPWEGGTVVLARLTNGETDEVFARRMATDARVFVVPCATFDLPGYLRIGLGMASDDFRTALARMEPLLFESKMRR